MPWDKMVMIRKEKNPMTIGVRKKRNLLAFRVLTAAWTMTVCMAQAEEKKGPLADRPSKPGPHLAKIQGLGSNQWPNLGKPAPDPMYGPAQGRTWSRKMAFIPDLRGAFIYGEGVHGGGNETG